MVEPMSSISLPGLGEDVEEGLLQLIEEYFYDGLTYDEMCLFLNRRHGLNVTVHQLKARLKILGLKRRGANVSIREIESAIREEKESAGKNLGYRMMWQRLKQKHHMSVPRDVVMFVCRHIDPDGALQRRRRRLKRRVYVNKGPDYLWHMDGYDKLKPYGFAIHGCIDGFSRRIMWLEVASTNNDPLVTCNYYLKCLKELKGVPRVVRSDRGTENTTIAGVQKFLRHKDTDAMKGDKSFLYGRSTANQRIESWWGHLRKNGVGFWMDFFKDLQDTGKLDLTSNFHKDCVRYCFMDVIQNELNKIAREWNFHRVRKSKQAESPAGIPELLYHAPEIEGGRSHRFNLDVNDLQEVDIDQYRRPKPMPFSDEFKNLADKILADSGRQQPGNVDEALDAFSVIVDTIADDMEEN